MHHLYLISAVFAFILFSCSDKKYADEQASQQYSGENITYFSLNQAVQQGAYDGDASIGDMKKAGNFGLGSSSRLVYEIVLLDGIAYGIPENGQAVQLQDSITTAFAAVKAFRADESFEMKGPLSLENLQKFIDARLKPNSFSAIRIEGMADSIKYRCFPPQSKPYLPNKEVPNVFFERSGIDVVLTGFRTPASAKVLNDPPFHFHFVSKDKVTGGHVKSIILSSIKIEVDYASTLEIKLPDPALVHQLTLDSLK